MTRPRPGGSVLIGFADALAAPEAAASLLGAGHRVASFARRGKPVSLRRLAGIEFHEVTAPEIDVDACAAEIAAIASRYDVTMPLDDTAVMICDGALPDSCAVAGPRGPRATLALDKRLQLRAAVEAGFRVPEWIELTPGNSIPDWLADTAVLKPALAVDTVDGRTRRLNPRVVVSSAEVQRLREAWGETPALLQRWVHGTGGGVFGLADPSGSSRLTAHRRVRMMNPAGSGSSACISTPVLTELAQPVERMLDGATWRGMFMVEVLHSADDGPWFMELNGRAWGSLALARRLGFEYPAWAIAQILDPDARPPEPPPFREILCRNLGRELIHLLFVLRGPGAKGSPWPGRWATVQDVARLGSNTSWYNHGAGLKGVFAYDAWRTVVDQTWAKRR